MTIENPDLDPLPGLPEELEALDRELLGLTMSERPSFGPELKAELERSWVEDALRPRSPEWRTGWHSGRRVVAAAAVAVLLGGLTVPPARASLVSLSREALTRFGLLDVAAEAPLPRPTHLGMPPIARPAPPIVEVNRDEPVAFAPERPAVDVAELPSFTGVAATFPELADRAAREEAIRRYYPDDLLRRGIGGTVRFRLWVADDGRYDNVNVLEGSGEPKLDAAALRALGDLDFTPATRGGTPVGTWVEFDMKFEPTEGDRVLPSVGSLTEPGAAAGRTPAGNAWPAEAVIQPPVSPQARDLLALSMAGLDGPASDLGDVESLLLGVPPEGVATLGWRSDAMDALERALERDASNPAPYLALGRILLRQGLERDAEALFEEGIARAGATDATIPPALLADLHYERGMVLARTHAARSTLGTLELDGVEPPRCPRAPSALDPASTDALLALNFLCPAELDRVVTTSFRYVDDASARRDDMLDAFRDAVAAEPGHVGANIGLLLDLADEERWFELLNGARRFAWASGGHPHAMLLSGLALQRMGRSEEARDEFDLAFSGLPEEQAAALRDTRGLRTDEDAAAFEALDGTARRHAERVFWARLDPILSTRVNEREVEHLSRGAYALLRFGGTRTDAGELWVRYGAPTAVRTLGEGTGLRTELWDYGQAPYVAFERPAGSTTGEMTPEAAAFTDDLLRVFPHRYGSRARRVFTLPAQTARFHDGNGGSEVEIRTRVPEELRNRDGRPLRLGLFTLGPDGELLTDTIQDLTGEDIRVRMPVPAGGTQMVLEIHHPEEGDVAAVRTSVPRGGDGVDDARISDLLLVEAVEDAPRTIERRDGRLRPRAPAALTTDRVGAVFELYGLGTSSSAYRIRVDAVPAGGGPPVELSFQPSGQALYGASWSRRPLRVGAPVSEYLTLDVSPLEPGEWTVRVRVTLPDGKGDVTTAGALVLAAG